MPPKHVIGGRAGFHHLGSIGKSCLDTHDSMVYNHTPQKKKKQITNKKLIQFFEDVLTRITLPKTNIAPKKCWLPSSESPFQWPMFSDKLLVPGSVFGGSFFPLGDWVLSFPKKKMGFQKSSHLRGEPPPFVGGLSPAGISGKGKRQKRNGHLSSLTWRDMLEILHHLNRCIYKTL